MFNFSDNGNIGDSGNNNNNEKPPEIGHDGLTGDAAINTCLQEGLIEPSKVEAKNLPYWSYRTIIGVLSKSKPTKVTVVKTTGSN
jgi:hypothetical protein